MQTWPMIASIIWISRQLSITVVFGDDLCEVSIMPNHAYQNYEQLSEVFTAFKLGKFSCMFLGPLLACPVRVRGNALDSSLLYPGVETTKSSQLEKLLWNEILRLFLESLLACPVRVRMNALDSSSTYSSSSKLPKKIRISSLKTSFDTVS